VRRWWVVEYATNQRSSYSRRTPFSEVQFLFIPTDARERPQAERLSQVGKDYSEMAPRLAEWQELNGPESLTISSMPVGHRRRPRTSKLMERLNEGIERRTRVQDLFPNEA